MSWICQLLLWWLQSIAKGEILHQIARKKKHFPHPLPSLCQVAAPNCQLQIAKLATPVNPLHCMYTLQIAHRMFFYKLPNSYDLFLFCPNLCLQKILQFWHADQLEKGANWLFLGAHGCQFWWFFYCWKEPFQTLINFFSTLLSKQFERLWIQFFLTFSTLVIVCSVVHNLGTWCQNSQVIYLNPSNK